MNMLVNRIRRFINNEDGPTAVEYAVMVALIAVAIIVTVQALGTNLNTTFQNVSDSLPSGNS
ncbi:Flp family type IVb pilin [Tautonia plasticadhaerens]|nr:Flp family type IVb pilin [Tautonia plasticadhaerens]